MTDERLDERLLEEIRSRALSQSGRMTGADVAEAVRASGLVVGSGATARVVRLLQDELTGLGPLQRFAERPGVTDVLVDGGGKVWIDQGSGLQPTDYTFGSAEDVRRLAVRMVSSGGRRLDEAEPCADVVLGRYRIHAVLPPIASGGPLLSVRVRAPNQVRLGQLLAPGDPWLPVLKAIVAARQNLLISGGTGSGKTTLLSALLAEAGHQERLIIVEDALELVPDHPHVVNLQCRTGNVEGIGAVGLDELIRQSLRMRPDRLIVGECRGAELRDFLAAMNTGHDGAGGTLHASSASAVPARLIAMGSLAGLSPEATALQAASAVDLVLQMRQQRVGAERDGAGSSRRGPQTLAALELVDGSLTATPLLEQSAQAGWVATADAVRVLEPLTGFGLPRELLRSSPASPHGRHRLPRELGVAA